MTTVTGVINRKGMTEHAETVTYTGMATNDTGYPIKLTDYADRTVQVDGTFGGATIVWEGSNDGTNYFTLSDPNGVALSFTAAGLKQVVESCLYQRPKVTGGSGAAINATVLVRRQRGGRA